MNDRIPGFFQDPESFELAEGKGPASSSLRSLPHGKRGELVRPEPEVDFTTRVAVRPDLVGETQPIDQLTQTVGIMTMVNAQVMANAQSVENAEDLLEGFRRFQIANVQEDLDNHGVTY